MDHNCEKHELCWASVRAWSEWMTSSDKDLGEYETDSDLCTMDGVIGEEDAEETP